jgi:lipoprotein-anchoring transpeptidase ErfK/SrfK
MRVYQNGKLIRAFHVTTGRVELPSVPGVWPVLDRESPTIFRSSEPRSSPYWYPDTPINYAILYHQGGYFVHDSWWRANYGVGTNFPHYDTGGDETFAGNGSHGCINLPEDQAAWVYNHTDWNTLIVVY